MALKSCSQLRNDSYETLDKEQNNTMTSLKGMFWTDILELDLTKEINNDKPQIRHLKLWYCNLKVVTYGIYSLRCSQVGQLISDICFKSFSSQHDEVFFSSSWNIVHEIYICTFCVHVYWIRFVVINGTYRWHMWRRKTLISNIRCGWRRKMVSEDWK